ncbi:MAG: peptidoglycan-binding protein [Clostridia bacterium]|nr:peptidoglycan-binding protein [Clostridia bacterium]
MVELLQLSKGKLRKNPQIYTVQRLLKQMGYYDMDIDGAFGEGTEKAVKTFQAKQNIVADGIVGMNTWNKLLK